MLPKFELYMPDTLEEACRLKAEGAEVVAGGTDVFVNMHGGKDRSGKVVDIKNIPALQGHTFDEAQGLDLGALTTHREIELWDVIKKHYRAMFEGCSRVGSVQIRTRGTLGGNICNGQVATQYVDLEGNPSMDIDVNPNGSLEAIEGIFSPDGRVFGKMGHLERRGPLVGKNIPGEKHQPLFESGAEYFK